jgi:hypothetical protein
MNLIDVTRELNTDAKCHDFLEKMRWPAGVRCVKCDNERVEKYQTNETTRTRFSKKKQAVVTVRVPARRVYQCLNAECMHQFTTTTGTIFNDTHLPLQKWFAAVALMMEAKKGLSANQMKRHLGVNYRTAWHLCHRIREAMKDNGELLTGQVEVDETYVGGKIVRRADRHKPRKEKDIVLGMVERGGRLKLMPIADMKAKIVEPKLGEHISPRVKTVYTDEHTTYKFAIGGGQFIRKHKTINHSKTYGIGTTHTNTIENAFSLFKRGLIGSYHKVSIKHLRRYCDEFSYRFNRRDEQHWMFEDTVRNLVNGKVLTYDKLTSPVSAS